MIESILHRSITGLVHPPTRKTSAAARNASTTTTSTSTRDWSQIYAIYGLDDSIHPFVLLLLLTLSFLFSIISFLILILSDFHFPGHHLFSRLHRSLLFSLCSILSLCLFLAALNIFYSSVPLRWEMSQRMVEVIGDWSGVRTALDVGCGKGILLNAVALKMKMEGRRDGRVVGVVDSAGTKKRMKEMLKRAGIEGVQEYVTCRESDVRRLPFNDDYFDVVMSGAFLHRVGKEYGPKTAAAAAQRLRVLAEVVRVLKPGGIGVVWDLVHVPEYVRKLHELKMEDVRVSERVTAYLTSSHIVSFRKPRQQDGFVGPGDGEVRLDWRSSYHNLNNLC